MCAKKLHTENYKRFLKEIVNCLNKCVHGESNFFSKFFSRFKNTIAIKNLTSTFVEIGKLILKFYGNKRTYKNQDNLEKNEAGWLTLPDFKTYCKAIVIRNNVLLA